MARPEHCSEDNLSVALLNINGLREKTFHLQDMMACERVHVVALCETRLDPSIKDSKVFFPGFRMWRRDMDMNVRKRTNPAGGVALYVQDHIKTKLRLDLMKPEIRLKENKIEIIWVQIELPGSRPMLVGSFYIHPPVEAKCYPVICEMMTLVSKEKDQKDILLMGDFNVDWNSEIQRKSLKDVFDKCGLCQIVDKNTRGKKCIDHIYTNINQEDCLKINSIKEYYSDHNLVTLKLKYNNGKRENYRSDRKLSEPHVTIEWEDEKWTVVYNEGNTQEALSSFTETFLRIAQTHAPLETKDIYDSLKLVSEGSDQNNSDSDTGSGINCYPHRKQSEKYKKLKELQKIRKKERRDNFMKQKPEIDNKNILKICEEYFGESLPSHVINITQQGDVASDLYYLREEKIFDGLPVQTSTDTFSFSELDDNEGRKWLESLLRTDMKDADIPEIDAELLKSSAGSISGPIRHILNLCLENHEFPSELNQFEFIPFSTKKLTKFRENSLHLHSVHVMMGYILDIILYKQAERHFIHKKLIASESIDDQIKNLKTDWLTATESGKTVSCWFLDFSSSFDSISHDWLLTKLEESGFSDSALDLIESFLSYHEGSCGLQRGSFLARLLFTVFINNLKRLVGQSSAVICQNHMIVYTEHENSETSKKQLEAKIQSVKEWAGSHTIKFQKRGFRTTGDTSVTSVFKLLESLLVCNQTNKDSKLKDVNWVQVLKKVMESHTSSGRKKLEKTFKKHEKDFGSKKLCKDDIDCALKSLVLL